jgi:hypothetical protein
MRLLCVCGRVRTRSQREGRPTLLPKVAVTVRAGTVTATLGTRPESDRRPTLAGSVPLLPQDIQPAITQVLTGGLSWFAPSDLLTDRNFPNSTV